MKWLYCFLALTLAFMIGESHANEKPRVNFENDLIPIFTKLGCNSGACHGAAAGRGGFNLSLYGGDPAADFDSIVRQFQGRRVNLSRPEDSLILLKPTESIAHEGGYLIEEEHESYRLLHEWIRQGASFESKAILERVELEPAVFMADCVGDSFDLRAVAHFSDGTQRDVTSWTVFSPEDSSAIEIDDEHLKATVLRRGRHVIVARYLTEVMPIECLLPLNDTKLDSKTTPPSFIDQAIERKLALLGLPTSPRASNPELVRRITLDLTGRLPEKHDLEFGKALIDKLLASEEFVEFWTLKFAKLLRIKPSGGRDPNQGAEAAQKYHDWLAEQIRMNAGLNLVAKQTITASGKILENGPANFYRTVGNAKEQAEFVSELFMGSRLRCANCHNHPLDKWTQDDYHGLAAIFAKVEFRGPEVKLKPRGEVIHPKTSTAATPRLPGENFLSAEKDGRIDFANWLTRDENPYFSKAIVNRIWSELMGRGLVSPVDDFRSTNPATHPDLLNELARDFAENGYQLRHIIRQIVLSDAYSRSANALVLNKDDDRFYSHRLKVGLEPEVLADAIADVLQISESYGGLPIGTRAVEIMNPKIPSRSLDVLGRCSREDSCESQTQVVGGLPQKLHLLNGPLLNARISTNKGRLASLLQEGLEPLEIVEQFYAVALNRKPTDEEQNFWNDEFATTSEKEHGSVLEDFVWSLLTCEEFVTNH